LLVVVGLLEGTLDGDDPVEVGHLQLQVGVVGDDHELGEAWPAKESMLDAGEVHHLKSEWLLLEVVRLAEGHGLLPRDDPVEWHSC
jgi:hypothetical protein